MEVGHTVGAAVGGRQAVGPALFRPAGARGGPNSQRSELVEGKDPVREVLQDVLDPVEFGVTLRVGGPLPGLGALEGDTAAAEQAA